MNLSLDQRNRLKGLLHAMRDDSITADEASFVNQLLIDSHEARELYFEHVSLVVSLKWLLEGEKHFADQAAMPTLNLLEGADNCSAISTTLLASNLPTANSLTPSGREQVELGSHGTRRLALGWLAKASRRIPGGEFTVGALILLAVAAAFWGLAANYMQPLPRSGGWESVAGLHEENVRDKNRSVATIANLGDAQWIAAESGLPTSKWEPNAPIKQGERLQIDSGMVELKLAQGTKLLIEGPARWTIDGENLATLKLGKLVAQVPPQATGFTVQTPTARVIDLSTQFGVEVDERGISEVHVLKGEVQVQANGQPKNAQPQRLTAGQSANIASGKVELQETAPINSKFTDIAKRANAASGKGRGYRVLFHYRFGGQAGAQAGQVAVEKALCIEDANEFNSLTRVGQPTYAAGSPRGETGLSLNLSSKDQAEGYLGDKFTELPYEYCVLEAWVRLRSDKQQVIAYAGHPSYNGFGLLVVNGHIKGMHGSIGHFESGTVPPLNKWTHLAWVRELAYVQLYINGQAVGPRQQAACKRPEPKLYIGHAPGNAPQTLDGQIAEVRLIRLNREFEPTMLLCAESNETK